MIIIPRRSIISTIGDRFTEALEDYEKALDDYVHVTKTIKNIEEIWFRAGRAAYNCGKIGDAKKYMEEALKINPNYREAKEFLKNITDMV